jgi:hypothetical protein
MRYKLGFDKKTEYEKGSIIYKSGLIYSKR